MSKTRLFTLIIAVFVLLLPVLLWADLTTSVTCEQENIFDSGDNCSWPYGYTGTRCCCWCPDPTGAHSYGHVMDLGQVVSNSDVYFDIRPGAGDAGCITTGYMYYSIDGTNWSLFWTKPNLAGWTTYTDTVHITDNFRYVRANTDDCSVDWSKVDINGTPDLTSGLVAYWSFDNCNATDDSGNGHNGALYGNPQCVNGEKGKAFSFDGQDDYIETQPLGINTGDSFTVSFWMNFEWQDHRIWTLYFGNPNNCGNNGFHSLINVDNVWGLDRGVVQYGPHCGTQNQFNIANFQGQWIHVVTVCNSDEKTLKSYINADIMDLDEFVEFSMTNNGLNIGQVVPYMEPWNANSYYKGIIDEVRIYNRALSEAGIQALYGGGSGGDSDGDGLPDSWEISHFGDLIQNPGDDYDHDELTNLQEYQLGTDPTKWDTDGDGVNDGTEVANGTNPLIPDVTLEPNISVEPLSQDFGELFVGDCDLQLFTVKNTGNADLNVSGISLSDTTNYDFDTTIIYACSTNGQTITPGDSCNVVVKFCPSTSGTFEANLSLSSNDPDTLTLNVPVTGSAKKLCDPPGTVYAKNDNAYGLFEGTVHDVETGDTTTVVIDIQGTDLIDLPLLKPWRLELWVSIDKIIFDSSVVTAVEPNGNGSDDLGAFFADEHVIAPGTHASFQASFCKPGTITFELGHNIKAQLLTAADFYLSVFGNFTPDQVFKFADSIDNIPLVASSLKHISNAFDAAANKKLGKAREELTLAAEDVRKIASNKRQFNQLLNAYVDLGLNISAKKLVSALLKGIPFKMIKVFGDAIVYNIKTGLGTKPIQIIVIAN